MRYIWSKIPILQHKVFCYGTSETFKEIPILKNKRILPLKTLKFVELIQNLPRLSADTVAENFTKNRIPRCLFALFLSYRTHSVLHAMICNIFYECIMPNKKDLISCVIFSPQKLRK